MTDLEMKLVEALAPFIDMADALDDAEDLVDDCYSKEQVNLSFGGMTMGDWDRDDFRRAQRALEAYREAASATHPQHERPAP